MLATTPLVGIIIPMFTNQETDSKRLLLIRLNQCLGSSWDSSQICLAPKADARNTAPHASPGPSGGDAAPAMIGVIIGALIHGD